MILLYRNVEGNDGYYSSVNSNTTTEPYANFKSDDLLNTVVHLGNI